MCSHRQMSQNGRNRSGAQLVGVTFVVEADEPFDSPHVRFFGTDGIMFQADGSMHLVAEFGGMHARFLILTAGQRRARVRSGMTGCAASTGIPQYVPPGGILRNYSTQRIRVGT